MYTYTYTYTHTHTYIDIHTYKDTHMYEYSLCMMCCDHTVCSGQNNYRWRSGRAGWYLYIYIYIYI